MPSLRSAFSRLIELSTTGRIREAPATSLAINYFNLVVLAAGLTLTIGVPFAFKNKIGGAVITGLFLLAGIAARQASKAGYPVVAFNSFAVLFWLLSAIQVVASQQVGIGGLLVCSFLPAYGAIAGFGLATFFAGSFLIFTTVFFIAVQMGLTLPIYLPGTITASILIMLFALPVSLLPLPTVFRQINEALARSEREIEERRLAELALKHSTERLADFSSSASDWFWETDAEHRFSFISHNNDDRASEVRDMIIGRTRWELSPKHTWQEHQAALAARQSFRDFEYPITTQKGETNWLSISGKATFAPNGDFRGYRGTAADITQRKGGELEIRHARDAAESANRATSQFLANLSHEVRTPLNGIFGMTTLLEMGELSEEQAHFLSQLKESAGLLKSMLDRILSFAQLEAGTVKARHEPFSPREVSEIAIRRHQAAAGTKGLTLAMTLDPRVPDIVVGDSAQLLEILDNLLDNAVKFTDVGEVALDMALAPEAAAVHQVWIVFTITDTGCGIAPPQIEANFAAFSQSDGSITRKAGGNGLGLALCRSVVKLLKGRITATSTVGVGSAFRVDLPFDTMAE